jgi:hypothetical protein
LDFEHAQLLAVGADDGQDALAVVCGEGREGGREGWKKKTEG